MKSTPMFHRYSRILATLLMLIGSCGVVIFSATLAVAQTNARARLEPEAGTYFGVNLDWEHDSAAHFNARLGVRAATYVSFVDFPYAPEGRTNLATFIQQVSAQRGIAILTLQPQSGLNAITPEVAEDLATDLTIFNNAYHVPIMLRFAPQMNGSWYPWGQQPEAYVRAFRTLAASVHQHTPNTAMLWAPAYADGYPFTGGQYAVEPGSSDFALLDTNQDGELTAQDDAYMPYYPGDDAVDWVGLPLLYWGNAYPWGENEVPEEGTFVSQLTDFYQTFAGDHAKPMAVETAAFYAPSAGGADELTIKQAWWQQIFDPEVAQQFPNVKMIDWYEWRAPNEELGGTIVDWTISQNADVARAFQADLPRERLVFGPVTQLGVQTLPSVSGSPLRLCSRLLRSL